MTPFDKDAVFSRFKDSDVFWLTGLSAVLLLSLLPFAGYIVALPLIQDEWQMTHTGAAIVFSSYLLGSAISALILVPLTDRFSPQGVYMSGLIILVAGNLLFPLLAWQSEVASLLRFVAGAGHIAAYVPGIQLVSRRYAAGKRGTAVGIFVSAGYAGTTLSYTFMGLLLNVLPSWRQAYLVTAAAGLLGLALAWPLMRATKQGAPEATESTTDPNGSSSVPRRGRLQLGVLRNRAIVLVIAAYTLHTAELYIARLWFPSLLGDIFMRQGMTPITGAALAATWSGFMFMTGIGGVLAGGFISDYWGRSVGAAFIFSLSGLCSFVAGWLLDAPVVFILVLGFVYGFATAADSAIYSTAVTELAPPDRVGSTQALQSFVGFAVGALLPVVTGSILDTAQASSAWGLAFSFNGLLALVGLAALLWLRRLPEAAHMAAGKG